MFDLSPYEFPNPLVLSQDGAFFLADGAKEAADAWVAALGGNFLHCLPAYPAETSGPYQCFAVRWIESRYLIVALTFPLTASFEQGSGPYEVQIDTAETPEEAGAIFMACVVSSHVLHSGRIQAAKANRSELAQMHIEGTA